jgi:cytochrome o ubiquinol oxidase subunit IV
MDFHTIEKKKPKPFFIGLILSLLLTIFAFKLSSPLAIGALALIQGAIQLFYFLDLGKEEKPRWNLIVFLCTLLIIFIIVAGSLWIMYHLNYNLMMEHD